MDRWSWLDADGEDDLPDVLWEDGERKFCRIWRRAPDGSRQAFMAVLPVAEHPTADQIGRLAHEFALKEFIDGTTALRPLDLVRERGQAFLVVEHHDGEPLDRLIAQPMEIGRFLRLAIRLAGALTRVHERGLVHKDIKPSNILVDPVSDRIWLTGFGVATRLSRERQSPEPPEHIAGTLSHIAPEQTGRMNRSIDSRSDLYALGVTLYQMLTGSLPFTASDPMEWVHCHIARKPMPPRERCEWVPSQISAIVMKLLAKTPEQRYQTAAGVSSDFRRCLDEWQSRRAIDEFQLGERDCPDRMLIPEQLYGRENEVHTLLAAFDAVVAGGMPRLVLVCGHPGIGKSSVVNELHKVLVLPRGLFASGKFDQLKRDVPYATLAQAFQRLIRALLSKPEAELSKWRDELREALDPNGALVVELIPDLKFIIGEQPAAPDVPAAAAKVRFQLALRRLIGVFAQPEHPLALFLDDLQWLDAATLDLLEDLLIQPDLQHLLLVGAYRDNEVDAAHPLTRKLSAIRQSGANVQEIPLAPLKREDLARLISDALHGDSRRVMPLAQLVHEKTEGNPFFANQFLHSLVDQGLIAFEPGTASWIWDLRRIQAKGGTENVVDLMAGKLGRLPPITQRALKELACLGSVAETSTLSIVHGTSAEDLHSDLWEALRLELIVRSESSYRFVHDRVQEAAYSLIPEEQRAEAHLRIGRLLTAHVENDKREGAIFEIVGQLNRGSALMASQDEREQLAELNLLAGKRAKAAAAFASALNYLIAGKLLVTKDGWERQHHLVFELELHRAECEFLTAGIRAAEGRLTMLSSRAANAVERAAVVCLLADVDFALVQPERGVARCLECLRHAGLEIPMHPTEAQARAAYDRIWSKLGGRAIEDLSELPLMTDPATRATLDVLEKALPCARNMSKELLSLITCAAAELSLEHGNSDSSPYAYVSFGMIADRYFGNVESGLRFGRLGLELVERKGLRRFDTRLRLTYAGIFMPCTHHFRSCVDVVRRSFDLANQAGDRLAALSSRPALVSNLLLAGERLVEVEKEAEVGLEFARRASFSDFVDTTSVQAAFIRNLRGLTRRFGSFDDDRFDELEMRAHFASRPHMAVFECWFWIRRLQAHFFAGEYSAARDASIPAQDLLWRCLNLAEVADFTLYSALTSAACCDSASAAERRQHLEAMATHLQRLEGWARQCPENFENGAALVAAEIARIEERDLDAMRLYEQAIRSAHENGFVHNEALALELASGFYAARRFDKIARAYMRDARSCYLQWGADGKVRQLDQLHPYLGREDRLPNPARTVQTPVEHLDLSVVLKVLQAVSGETDLEKLIGTIMRQALEHSGAERALLILPRGDAYWIEAEAGIRGDAVTVAPRQSVVTVADLPESVFQYVLRTRESVLLHDASTENPFSGDEYIRRERARSVLCMPMLMRTRLVGVIYLENKLASGVFTPARMTLLKLLVSKAAISVENMRLYRDLQEREARVRRLVDSNIIGIVIWHADGRILDINDAFLRIIGFTREDLVAGYLRWTDLSPPEWRDFDARVMAELKERGAVGALEREFFKKDGSRVPVLVGGAIFEGSPDEGVAFVIDLTERKRAEEALRESERELRLLVDTIPALVWRGTPEGELDYLNERAVQYLGHTALSLRGGRWLDLVHSDHRDATVRRWLHSATTGSSYDDVYKLQRADGQHRWIQSVGEPFYDSKGRVAHWFGLITDIEDRKRAEAKLRLAYGHLAEAQRLSKTGSFITDMLADQRDWSEEMFRIFEFDSETKITLQSIRDVVHPDDLPLYDAAYQRAIEGVGFDMAFRIITPLGNVKHLHAVGHVMEEIAGRPVFIGAIQDVTASKVAEEALSRARSELTHVARITTLSTLTASIAHEVNQPLSGIITNASTCLRMLDADPPNIDGARETARRTLRDGARASEVIKRLRALFSRKVSEPEPVDLNEAAREVMALSLSELRRSRVIVRSELAEDLPPVTGDRVQLQQVILNLLLNASEAMSTIEDRPRQLVLRTARDGGHGVCLAVQDVGVGLDPRSVNKLFEPFYTTKTGGMGIGLSISRSIIERHHGRLWAEPNNGPGATFLFSIPSQTA